MKYKCEVCHSNNGNAICCSTRRTARDPCTIDWDSLDACNLSTKDAVEGLRKLVRDLR